MLLIVGYNVTHNALETTCVPSFLVLVILSAFIIIKVHPQTMETTCSIR